MTVPLRELALARSGDKGDTSNIGVVPYDPANLELVKAQVTVARVRELFEGLVSGDISCYEFPGISAINFVMKDALHGGVSRSLAMDTHGKAYASLMLTLEIDVPEGTVLRSEVSKIPCV